MHSYYCYNYIYNYQYFSNNILINFGPQHPSTHGVLRLVLQLNGEIVKFTDTHIGYLHRGTEMLLEFKNYKHACLYFDRLDYTSVLTQTHAYCLSIENIFFKKIIYYYYKYIRCIFSELSRLLNHLLVIATHSIDIGNMIPMFWAFEERENIFFFFEYMSGARMHVNYFKPFFCKLININASFFLELVKFSIFCNKTVFEFYILLITNKIWKRRLLGVGIISNNLINKFNITGPIARSCGCLIDMRLTNKKYDCYFLLKINSFGGINGDCFDRFIIRIFEIIESLLLILQLCSYKFFISNTFKLKKNLKKKIYFYFKTQEKTNNLINSNCGTTEAGKGEFVVYSYILQTKILRCKIKSPAFYHLQLLNQMLTGCFVSDIITIVGSQDLVFGEIDK